MTQRLHGERQQDVLPDEPHDVDLFLLQEAYIEFVGPQLVLPVHTRLGWLTVLDFKSFTDWQREELITTAAVESEVRGDLPPYTDPGWTPRQVKKGLDRPKKRHPPPRGIQKIPILAKVDIQPLRRDLGDIHEHAPSPAKVCALY
ncbi:MAG TPA: hypothetical protein VFF51_02610 [Candidatus Methylomirabilis sp.]|nr:hypothetical protein [Candidatus Methylomirabilis sp.]